MPAPLPLPLRLKKLIEHIAKEISIGIQQELDFECTGPEFTSEYLPDISVQDYLERFAIYCCLEEVNLIAALILFDRFRVKNTTYCITKHNILLILTTIIMAEQKSNNDFSSNNAHYNAVGGWQDLKLINTAERRMYRFLSWDLGITPETYEEYKKYLYFTMHPQAGFTPKLRPCLYEMSALPEDFRWVFFDKENTPPQRNRTSSSSDDKNFASSNPQAFLKSPNKQLDESQAFSIFLEDDENECKRELMTP